MTPYRGRGCGYGRGRSNRSNNMLPRPELTVPLIGDWTIYHNKGGRNMQQLPIQTLKKKEDIFSSSTSSSKIISYKEIASNEAPQEKEFFENPIIENILYIEDEDIATTPNDGWSLKTRYLESRGYAGLDGKARPNLEIFLTVIESVTIVHHYQNNNSTSFINFSKCHINMILSHREWGLRDGDESMKTHSSHGSMNSNAFNCLDGESQPKETQEPSREDLWDAMIGTVISAQAKEKGPIAN